MLNIVDVGRGVDAEAMGRGVVCNGCGKACCVWSGKAVVSAHELLLPLAFPYYQRALLILKL